MLDHRLQIEEDLMPFLFVFQAGRQPHLRIFVLSQACQQRGAIREFLAGVSIVAFSAPSAEDRLALIVDG